MKKEDTKTVAKVRRRTNQQALNTMLHGVAKLIEGQRHFAEEFGLGINRVFPEIYELLQHHDLEEKLRDLLSSQKDGAEVLEHIFKALAQHQLALMAALDGVALHTVKTLTPRITATNSFRMHFAKRLQGKQLYSKFTHYKTNHQARYRELVVPGFVNSYIHTREEKWQ